MNKKPHEIYHLPTIDIVDDWEIKTHHGNADSSQCAHCAQCGRGDTVVMTIAHNQFTGYTYFECMYCEHIWKVKS